MLRVIIIGCLFGIGVWLVFYALKITWLGYLFASIIISSIGWAFKAKSISSIDYLLDFVMIICFLGFWLGLIYIYDIGWAKALFLSSLLLLVGGLINQFDTYNES